MKHLFMIFVLYSSGFASLNEIKSFEADFIQNVVDEKNKKLSYSGHVVAKKPQDAVWNYISPITKTIYITKSVITIVEPELEQAIVKSIRSSFDFFSMIKDAKKVDENSYLATFKESKFTIIMKNKLIKSISYIDEFENSVKIIFENQKQNKEINKELFTPNIPIGFDIIRD